MKVLKFIKDAILTLLGTIFFVFALIMTILLLNFNDYGLTQFGENTFVIISNEVANEEFQKGDLVIVEGRGLEKYNVGDTIFAYRVDSKRNIHIDQGKIGRIYLDDKALAFENGNTYSEEFIAGVPINKYENIGLFLSVVESKWGFLFIVLVPSFLIFLYEVYALIIEVKYGAEDEEIEEQEKEAAKKKKEEKKAKKKSTPKKKDSDEGDEDDGGKGSTRGRKAKEKEEEEQSVVEDKKTSKAAKDEHDGRLDEEDEKDEKESSSKKKTTKKDEE